MEINKFPGFFSSSSKRCITFQKCCELSGKNSVKLHNSKPNDIESEKKFDDPKKEEKTKRQKAKTIFWQYSAEIFIDKSRNYSAIQWIRRTDLCFALRSISKIGKIFPQFHWILAEKTKQNCSKEWRLNKIDIILAARKKRNDEVNIWSASFVIIFNSPRAGDEMENNHIAIHTLHFKRFI